MNPCRFTALTALALLAVPAAVAQSPAPDLTLRYKFAPGQKVRYLIQHDPYFADPAEAIAAANPSTPYRPPVVERLTGDVQAVGPDGTAILRLTLGPEPGFEDEDGPQPVVTRTLRVSARGEVLSPVSDATDRDMAEMFVVLPGEPVRLGARWNGTALTTVRGDAKTGLAILTRIRPPTVAEQRSPDHDGVLLQTTRSVRRDRLVFDIGAGRLVRQRSEAEITQTLVMTERGMRGADDFGRVIPTVRATQTLTVERRDALPAIPALSSP